MKTNELNLVTSWDNTLFNISTFQIFSLVLLMLPEKAIDQVSTKNNPSLKVDQFDSPSMDMLNMYFLKIG